MYKVILVDDEKQILDGLASLIDWEELNLVIAGSVQNGKEALELIEQTHPQILITDIKMPILDGIELIRIVQEQFSEVRCLVLSGFDDFSLVREAMRCGAENYLLKPMDRDEFLQNLKEIVLTLEMQKTQPTIRWSGHKLLLNNLMNRIVRNDISHKEFRRKMEFLQIDIYNSAFALTVFDKPVIHQESALGDIEVHKQLSVLIEKDQSGIVFRDLAGRLVTLFFIDDQKDLSQMEELVWHFLMEVGRSWIAVSGDVVSSYRDLHISYRQGLDGLFTNQFLPLERFCHYRNLLTEAERTRQIAQPALDQLLHLFRNSDAKPSMGEILSALPEDFRNSLSMRFLCGILLAKVLQEVPGRGIGDSLSEDEQNLMAPALYHLNKNEWEAGLTALLKVSGELRNLWQKPVHSALVEKLISYVEDNYRDYDISLKILAGKMSVSPEHAGRGFKKETGRFFSSYLNEVRIRHACEMLRGTILPANDIALKVGYLNQNYFYTKFKKYTGMGPTEFRSTREMESSIRSKNLTESFF
jgi:two-component system, response regulator YesN